MRKLWLLVIFALSFSQIAAQDAAPNATIEFTDHPARVVTHINGLNVRSTPAIAEDNIVGRLQPGQQVHVLAREGDWQQVRSEGGLFGWSHSDYLIDLPPRQLGEKRQFRIYNADSPVRVNAELQHIGPHSYIYVAVNPERNVSLNQSELAGLARAFDETIFSETYALWAPDPRPSHEGDERIVILIGVGYAQTNTLTGAYHSRAGMPGELHPENDRTGFIRIEMSWDNDVSTEFLHSTAAHELQHLIQHHFDTDESRWVDEGLSVLTSTQLSFLEPGLFEWGLIDDVQNQPYAQLNRPPEEMCGYGCGFLFTTYILERLGLESLQDFARRPENGLAALDALLAERGNGLDTETFYADFVLANYLRDAQSADGRFGYQLLHSLSVPKPYVRGNIVELPALVQQSLPLYATDYYDFALSENDWPQALELTLQFPQSASQDAWLQLVQVVEGEVILQRYRASDYRDRMMPATFHPDAEQSFLAISPIGANARHLTAKQAYTLKIHLAGSEVAAADYAKVESTLALEPTLETVQRTPGQLTKELQATIDAFLENRQRIYAEGKIAEYTARVRELIAAGAVFKGTKGGAVLVEVMKHLRPQTELFAALLAGGADPNRGGSYMFSPDAAAEVFDGTPLNYAIALEAKDHVRMLLAAGAKIDDTVLLLAGIKGNTRIIQLLLDAGADPSLTTEDGETAADLARVYGHLAAADILEAAAARMN